MSPTSKGAADPGRDIDEVLQHGELTVIGRIRSASNATFLCEANLGDRQVHCVYKPVAGEAPLWDFPDGTLAGRERSAYLVSAALGWNIVPYTIIREGPAGTGMVQIWVEQPGDSGDSEDEPSGPDLVDLLPAGAIPPGYLPILQAYDYSGDEVVLVHADDDRLRRMAVFDVLVNNADRKGGHILCGVDGRVYGVDHGVTFHVEDKLRTVLWGWAGKPVDDQTLESVAGLRDALRGGLADELGAHITEREVAALLARTVALLNDPVMPTPDRRRPIPWPAF
ncbi:phosphatidylinositol 3-and 4-kinase [Mycolicibacterium phlei]|uniref:Phosphatidylinositol kinase n=1 Tax=Mycolicibacterium phlei DSM 43239 = CCUG 21000 TaxID=1226750 RepID=A0A5N5V4W9_MYCPH|nr:SCO1664 family protein [Mycolicibacterium phlei]VEG10165.1 phosphatidylinositol 3-and 4-kinase [Mycobacteroides chelonae]AMO62060.1 Phosphatidylinositol 3- and 4-kinase [Mycolicibacterium phlei]KAB7756971.1 phosphatidylinositol kinase [Mycolicibacterium phlei DSM 43239 = CCUG 21000]KXW62628.1 phosphatidylinositol kinase [Mycolicibacterium phlei DSM 43070]KXW66002.1 phosphatidylinositol kinase [Mycolicibacterium phlei DSM 43239 = CCUG 21000]